VSCFFLFAFPQKIFLHLRDTIVYLQAMGSSREKEKTKNPKKGLHLETRLLYLEAMETQGESQVLNERSAMVLIIIWWLAIGCVFALAQGNPCDAPFYPEFPPGKSPFPSPIPNANHPLWSG